MTTSRNRRFGAVLLTAVVAVAGGAVAAGPASASTAGTVTAAVSHVVLVPQRKTNPCVTQTIALSVAKRAALRGPVASRKAALARGTAAERAAKACEGKLVGIPRTPPKKNVSILRTPSRNVSVPSAPPKDVSVPRTPFSYVGAHALS